MMRGELDMSIDRHSAIERRLHNNLDTWLCNLYFEIKRLPRYTEGQREYEVELQYSSGMLGYPQRPDTSETAEMALASVLPRAGGTHSPPAHVRFKSEGLAAQAVSAPSSPNVARRRMMGGQRGDGDDQGTNSRRLSRMLMGLNMEVPKQQQHASAASILRRGGPGSRRGRPTPLPPVIDDREDGEDTEVSAEVPPKADPPRPASPAVKEMDVDEGLVYRVSQAGPSHLYTGNMLQLQPGGKGKGAAAQKSRPLSRAEQLERHVYSVRPQQLEMRSDLDFHNKTAYIWRQLAAELGPAQFKTSPFWVSVLCLLLAFWGRLYIHYVAQWLLLMAIGIPVSEFDFHAFTVALNYQR